MSISVDEIINVLNQIKEPKRVDIQEAFTFLVQHQDSAVLQLRGLEGAALHATLSACSLGPIRCRSDVDHPRVAAGCDR
jgi:hypothetical protein